MLSNVKSAIFSYLEQMNTKLTLKTKTFILGSKIYTLHNDFQVPSSLMLHEKIKSCSDNYILLGRNDVTA